MGESAGELVIVAGAEFVVAGAGVVDERADVPVLVGRCLAAGGGDRGAVGAGAQDVKRGSAPYRPFRQLRTCRITTKSECKVSQIKIFYSRYTAIQWEQARCGNYVRGSAGRLPPGSGRC